MDRVDSLVLALCSQCKIAPFFSAASALFSDSFENASNRNPFLNLNSSLLIAQTRHKRSLPPYEPVTVVQSGGMTGYCVYYCNTSRLARTGPYAAVASRMYLMVASPLRTSIPFWLVHSVCRVTIRLSSRSATTLTVTVTVSPMCMGARNFNV